MAFEQDYDFRHSDVTSHVTVKIGDILEADTQVIVSSDDRLLSATGGVSKAILAAGGPALRADMDKHVGALAVGDVAVTSSGTLAASHVFHAVTCEPHHPEQTEEEVERIIQSLTRKCIEKAVALDCTSIAFPALGTGSGRFKAPQVAAVMANTLAEAFEKLGSNPGPWVEIWLFQGDATEGLASFWEEFKKAAELDRRECGEHKVFLIHGIRTRGEWQEAAARKLREVDPSLAPQIPKYGYFNLLSFLQPLKRFRARPVESVKRDIRAHVERGRPVSVIAHSFGTYIVGELLKDETIKLHRVVLCGGILPADFDWQAVRDRVDGPSEDRLIVNDCGSRDIWPVMAQFMTFGYGNSGRVGFNTAFAENRFHPFSHSEFFKPERKVLEDYWLPLLQRGEIKRIEKPRPQESWWVNALSIFKLPFLVLAALGVAAWLVFLR